MKYRMIERCRDALMCRCLGCLQVVTMAGALAIEDVILPELEAGLNYMAAQLEEADQEDIVRVRLGARSTT